MAAMNWRRARFQNRRKLSLKDESDWMKADAAAKWIARFGRVSHARASSKKQLFFSPPFSGRSTLRSSEALPIGRRSSRPNPDPELIPNRLNTGCSYGKNAIFSGISVTDSGRISESDNSMATELQITGSK